MPRIPQHLITGDRPQRTELIIAIATDRHAHSDLIGNLGRRRIKHDLAIATGGPVVTKNRPRVSGQIVAG